MPHVTVGILTYKRSLLLKKTMASILLQNTRNLFSYSLIVVDNDKKRSAEEIVNKFTENSKIEITYYCVAEQNISLARNKVLDNSQGEYIAFIDDDEYADEDWLFSLFSVCSDFSADFVHGPVFPVYQKRNNFIIRYNWFSALLFPEGSTGYYLKATNNCMLRKSSVGKNRFDLSFGLIGGEDTEFFNRFLNTSIFVWTNKAKVFEYNSFQKTDIMAVLKRRFSQGNSLMKIWKKDKSIIFILLFVIFKVFGLLLETMILFIPMLISKELFVAFLWGSFFDMGMIYMCCGGQKEFYLNEKR